MHFGKCFECGKPLVPEIKITSGHKVEAFCKKCGAKLTHTQIEQVLNRILKTN